MKSKLFDRDLRKTVVILFLLITLVVLAVNQVFAQADWAKLGPDSKLIYKKDANGNRIMDFSYAGYMGGGVALPNVPVKVTVNAAAGDRTIAIQNAINQVAAMPLVNGFRGAVLLGAGSHNISATLNINATGVVVRGSGSSTGGTIINMTGGTPFRAFIMAGSGSPSTSNTVNITGSYIPSGTHTFTVSDASSYQVGNTILVYRTVTQEWIEFVGMDKLVRDGQPQTWMAPQTKISTDRIITAINGNTITIDAPLTDSFDATYLGTPVGTITKYTWPTRISQSGIENMKIQAPAGTAVWGAVTIDDAIDCWLLNVVGQNTQNAFNVSQTGKRITLEKVVNHNSVTQTATAATADFSCTGTQVFVNKCESTAKGIWPMIAGARGTGPIAVLNFKTADRGIEPHQRWTTGFLSDNCIMPNTTSGKAGISYRNRSTMGSGHGWCTAWSVAWNCETPFFLVSQAPGTYNWAIGGHGSKVTNSDPQGIYDHFNSTVTPSSLYLQQLLERLGPQALTNIGYGSGPACPPAIASGNDGNGNITDNVLDGNLTTRWSANGDGQWIQFCLENITTVTGVKIAFYLGNERRYSFDVLTSLDGTSWTTATSTLQSSGTSLNLETFPFAARQAKFVRIVGHGNTVNTWNSYTEVEIMTQTDNVPPAVAITSPANNSTFTAPTSITINATASDSDGTIAKVEFFEGQNKLGEDLTSPYNFPWTNVAPGNYTLTAKATDNGALATTSSNVSIIVNPNQPPSVSVTSPTDGSVFTAPATITLSANAADNDGTITKVEFFEGANKLGEDLTSPYSFTWNSITAGNYILTAKATDNGGLVTTSGSIGIIVNPNQAPSVTITSPANGATFTTPATIVINANATDSDGSISKVEFFEGANKLGEDLTAPYSFTWSNVAAGNYTLTVNATDNGGLATTSTPVTLTTNPGTGPLIFTPVHDAYARSGVHANTTQGTTDPGNLITKFAPSTQADNSRETYLKFDLTNVTGTISSVQLTVFGKIEDATVTNIPVGVFAVANTTWTESALTWNNKPVSATSALQSTVITDATARYYTWDITSHVKSEIAAGRKVISLAMKSGVMHNPRILWSSKETGSNPPQLSVEIASCEPPKASADDGNVAANVIDNDFATRWSASGDPQWIQLCLENVSSVNGVQIAFYKGNERISRFDVQVSSNGTTFTNAATNLASSGASLALENFPFPAQNAKYVRIVGHGNSLNLWNSYTEVRINSSSGSSSARSGTDEQANVSHEINTGKLSFYPNPANNQVTITYEVKKSGRVRLGIYNGVNSEATMLVDQNLSSGTYQKTFDIGRLPKGVHIIKLITDGKLSTQKLLKH